MQLLKYKLKNLQWLQFFQINTKAINLTKIILSQI